MLTSVKQGDLVAPETEETEKFILKLADKDRFWMAGRQCPENPKIWKWNDGTPMIRTNWLSTPSK